MDNTKKDWTAEERARFERIFCALITHVDVYTLRQNLSDAIKDTHEYIDALDNHYKTSSHEPTN